VFYSNLLLLTKEALLTALLLLMMSESQTDLLLDLKGLLNKISLEEQARTLMGRIFKDI